MTAWIFDIDGVITNLNSKKIEHPQIIQIITKILSNNEPVAFVTGRSIDMAKNNVLSVIEDDLEDKSRLNLLYCEGEFGAVTINYKNGNQKIHIDKSLNPPDELIKKGKEIIENYKKIFIYDQKHSFFTAEVKQDIDKKLSEENKDKLSKELQQLIDSMNKSEQFEVHKDNIAVNVRSKKLNKHLATKKVLTWLENLNVRADDFIAFGDSGSDIEIGRELHKQNKQLKFINTGNHKFTSEPFEVINIGNFDKGTLEYLMGTEHARKDSNPQP